MKTHIVQKALIIREDGKFLILRRSETDPRRPLQWDIPGGWFEDGETLNEGVEREVREETGLLIDNVRPIFAKTELRTTPDGEVSCVFIFYKATPTNESVEISEEHDQYLWVDLAEALTKFEYPLHIELFKYIQDKEIDLL